MRNTSRPLTSYLIASMCVLLGAAYLGDLSLVQSASAYPKAQPNGTGTMPKPMTRPPAARRPSSMPTSMPSSRPSALPRGKQAGVHPSSQPSSPQDQLSNAGFIYGEINIDEAMKAKVKAGSVLFVIVRRFDPQGKGMLIAATKQSGVTADSFPLRYVVKQSDAMMGAPLNGRVSVSARIDQDGDAISKQPNDIVGEASQAVIVGVNPVAFTLNKSL